MIKDPEEGQATAKICRKYGLSPAASCTLKAQYSGSEVSNARRLRLIEEANSKLRRLMAESVPLVLTGDT